MSCAQDFTSKALTGKEVSTGEIIMDVERRGVVLVEEGCQPASCSVSLRRRLEQTDIVIQG